MKISVVIINYNYAAFLERAIRSALGQTRPADEIIIVDDGSTDASIALVQPLLAQFPTLRLHAQNNGGQLAAVRSGVEQAGGDWIFFLDSDDEWSNGHLQTATACLESTPSAGMYFSGHRETSGPPLYRSKWAEGAFGPCSGLVASTGIRLGTIESTLGIRASLAREVLSFDSAWDQEWRMRAEDCLIFGASLAGAVVYHHPAQTVSYRIHGGNSFAGTDQSSKANRYNENKARLFRFWMDRFGIDPQTLAKRVYHECLDHHANRANRAVLRRCARALRRAPGSRWKNLWRSLRLQLIH